MTSTKVGAHTPSLEERVRALRARRKGCEHCESALDAALAEIMAEARTAVGPIIEGESEGERTAHRIMDMRLALRDCLAYLTHDTSEKFGERKRVIEQARAVLAKVEGREA